MSELQDLRGEVARLRKAATRKVSRVKKTSGAELSGSAFDPRRAPHREAKYTKSQLATYKRELQGFLARSNQFVGLAEGQAVPRGKWERYKSLESQHNARVNEGYQKVANIELPSGEPIASRMARSTPDHRHMRSAQVNALYDPIQREPQQVNSLKGLDKLIAQYMDRVGNKNWRQEKVATGRRVFDAMADRIGNEELADKMAELTDEQFDVLWNYTDFPREMSLDYQHMKLLHEKRDVPYMRQASENAAAGYADRIKWAKGLQF